MTTRLKLIHWFQAIVCMAVLSTSFTVVAAQHMIFADSFPLEHPLSSEGTVYWMNQVTELTDGAITFQHFPAEQLAPADQILQKIKDGVAQAGYVGIGYVSDDLPLNGGTMLPGVVENTVTASEAYWNLLSSDSLLRQEFLDNGVVPVFAVLLPPYQVVLNRAPVQTMADLKGLKLRVSGSMSLVANAIGASPVSMSAPDIYMAMRRGTLDGSLLPVTSITPYKIDEVTQSVSSNASFGSFGITVVMDAETYAQLTDAQKAAIKKAGDQTVEHLSTVLQQGVEESLAAFRDSGITVYSFSDELQQKLAPKFDAVQERWAARMKERGLPGAKALEQIDKALAAAK